MRIINWIIEIVVESLVLLFIWNIFVVLMFGAKPIAVLTSIIISVVLSLGNIWFKALIKNS